MNNYISQIDINFINHLYKIASYGGHHRTAQIANVDWQAYINLDFFRNNGKLIYIDSTFCAIPRAIIKTTSQVINNIKGPIYDVQYKKQFPAKYFLVNRYMKNELVEVIDNE